MLKSAMHRRKLAVLTAVLALVIGGAEAQRGTVQSGAQRTFSVADLTNNNLGRIVASSNYQVSITLPAEVQNIGVNASKQAALVPTVDKSDGRVIYLDVVKPGGFATLNIRLVSKDEPLILKMTVELSEATGGVLAYTVESGTPAAAGVDAPSLVSPPRPSMGTAAAVPARPAPAAVTPPTRTPAASATPARAERPTAATPPPAQAASTPPFVREQDGLRVEVAVTAGQDGATRTLTYHIRDIDGGDHLSYILVPKVTVRGNMQGVPQHVNLAPNGYRRITAGGVQGSLALSTTTLPIGGRAVVLFEVQPVDTQAQRALPSRYVGVLVRP